MDRNQTTRTNKQGSIPSLYVLKAICAYAVVALHAPIGVASELIGTLGQIAVPIFFMVTGYFLYSEDGEQLGKRLESSIKKVAIIWLILNVLLTAISWNSIPPFHDWVVWGKWIFMGHHYSYGHLWYITALLQTLLFFYILTKLRLGRYIYLFSSLWILRTILGDLRPLIFGEPESMVMSCNFALAGVPYIATGILIRKYEAHLKNTSALASVGIISFIGLTILSVYTLPQSNYWIYILKPINNLGLILSCFLFALHNTQIGTNSTAEYIGKNLSGNIYYWHAVVITVCRSLIPLEGYSSWGAIIVSILSTMVAYLVVRLQKACNVNYLP